MQEITLIVPIILHVIGFCLLCRTKYKQNFGKIQRLYLLNLSLVEILLCVVRLPPQTIQNIYIECVAAYGSTMLICTYFLITMDRFLMAYFSIRYNLLVTMRQARWMFLVSHIISACLPSITILQCKYRYQTVLFQYILLPAVFVYLLFTAFTYTYIFISNKRRKNKVTRSTTTTKQKHTYPQLLPSLLIVSFVVFFLCPALTFAYFSFLAPPHPIVSFVLILCYSIGYSLDALLYIFSLNTVRKRFICSSYPRRSTNNKP